MRADKATEYHIGVSVCLFVGCAHPANAGRCARPPQRCSSSQSPRPPRSPHTPCPPPPPHDAQQLKARLAKLRTQLLEPGAGGAKGGEGFEVGKTGDARVSLIGFPSVGKSTMLTVLTGTESVAAAYEFTTLTCIPGNIMHKGTKIQLLDLPGIIEGAAHGKGRGRQVIAVAKSSDLVMMVLDAGKEQEKNHRRILENELESVGLRLNKTPPNVYFRKKKAGGVKFSSVVPLTKLGDDPYRTVYNILHEYKIHNADLLFRCVRARRVRCGHAQVQWHGCARRAHSGPSGSPADAGARCFSPPPPPPSLLPHTALLSLSSEDIGSDELIDLIEGNRKYVRCLYVFNKIDTVSLEELDVLAREPHSIVISAGQGLNLDRLIDRTWDYLGLTRCVRAHAGPPAARAASSRSRGQHLFPHVGSPTPPTPHPPSPPYTPPPPHPPARARSIHTKRRGQPPDIKDPVVLTHGRHGISVESLCDQIHKDMKKVFKYALVWGTSTKHAGVAQHCGLQHVLHDEDVVQIVTQTVSEQKKSKDYAKNVQAYYDKYKAGKKKSALKS